MKEKYGKEKIFKREKKKKNRRNCRKTKAERVAFSEMKQSSPAKQIRYLSLRVSKMYLIISKQDPKLPMKFKSSASGKSWLFFVVVF